MQKGTVANLEIDCLILKHPKQKKMKYQDEMDYIVSSKKRNEFLCNLVFSLKGNTLVLFQYVEKHGQVLFPMLEKRVKNLHYVYGGTDALDRELVREKVEKSNDSVILASYGVFSTGVNIKKINNIVFASPTKSRIRNLQSIGRGLRVSDDKKNLKLFDIADDLQCENYTLNHLKERINIYNEEKFVYNMHTINLK
jgi:superfamily II DNA or RNA helicase